MKERSSAGVFLLGFAIVLGSWVVLAAVANLKANAKEAPQTEAELWLSWSAESKSAYVWGYLHGFERGQRDACYFYEEKMPTNSPVPVEKLPRRVCLDSLPEFTEKGHYEVYVDTITNYYTKYPHDREGGLPLIMDLLATPPGLKNVDQIHARLGD
jgi:hypothetical protein